MSETHKGQSAQRDAAFDPAVAASNGLGGGPSSELSSELSADPSSGVGTGVQDDDMQISSHPGTQSGSRARAQSVTQQRRWLGLPGKLLLLTAAFVMLAEVLIFVPSIANFRVTWLTTRLTSARLAALAATAVPDGAIPAMMRDELLNTAQVRSVAIKQHDQRRLVLAVDMPIAIDASFDLTPMKRGDWWSEAGYQVGLIKDALDVFWSPKERIIRVTGQPQAGLDGKLKTDEFIEIVLPQAPLYEAMVRHGLNILGLSIIISLIAAALVYFALSRVLVQPMMRLTRNMVAFRNAPENSERTIEPSGRRDEIGIAEQELRTLQMQVTQALKQKDRLAQLGLAVSKINHDLRNMLSSTQLMSDRLASLPDATVQRLAPKLINSLDRAIAFCNSTLQYGRAEEAPPKRSMFALAPLLVDVGDSLDLPRQDLGWEVDVPDWLQVDADREFLFRILNNLCRNAVQAIESAGQGEGGVLRISATRLGRAVQIDVHDTGPGVSAQAQAHLFQAFQGGVRRGGTGLGLAIAHELVTALGGQLTYVSSQGGAHFRIEIPDRKRSG